MQNRYAGDIGDYSKFILLKKLFGNKRIGLNWYLYPDEHHNNDGKHISYHYENDYGILKILRESAHSDSDRNIAYLERRLREQKIFEDIVYFNECIENSEGDENRANYREKWFARSLACFGDQKREVVFVDPDNGLQVPSIPGTGRSKAGKYVFYHELEKLLEMEGLETLIIYQHYRRVVSFREKILDEVKRNLSEYTLNYYALGFHKMSARVYLILSRHDLDQQLRDFVGDTPDWRYP
jgi:hypothetical protein